MLKDNLNSFGRHILWHDNTIMTGENIELQDILDAVDRLTILKSIYSKQMESSRKKNEECYKKTSADIERMRKSDDNPVIQNKQHKLDAIDNENKNKTKKNRTNLNNVIKKILRLSGLIKKWKDDPFIDACFKGQQVLKSGKRLEDKFERGQVDNSKLEAHLKEVQSSVIRIDDRFTEIKNDNARLVALREKGRTIVEFERKLEEYIYKRTFKTLKVENIHSEKPCSKNIWRGLLEPSVIKPYNIGTGIDINNKCWAPGILELTETQLILTDWNNSCLKWFDLDSKTITWSWSLKSKPWGITIIPESRIAVTFPDTQQISYFKSDRDLDFCGQIPVDGRCLDIHSSGDKLFVTYICPQPKIQILALTAQVLKEIQSETLDNLFVWPMHCAVSQDSKRLYVTDNAKHTLTCLDTAGTGINVLWTYKDQQFKYPTGVITGFGDCIYVCSAIHDVKTILAAAYSS